MFRNTIFNVTITHLYHYPGFSKTSLEILKNCKRERQICHQPLLTVLHFWTIGTRQLGCLAVGERGTRPCGWWVGVHACRSTHAIKKRSLWGVTLVSGAACAPTNLLCGPVLNRLWPGSGPQSGVGGSLLYSVHTIHRVKIQT